MATAEGMTVRTNEGEVDVSTATTEQLLDLSQRWTNYLHEEAEPGIRDINRELDMAINHGFANEQELEEAADRQDEIARGLVCDIEILEAELGRRAIPLPDDGEDYEEP